jgi:hypothetical protein
LACFPAGYVGSEGVPLLLTTKDLAGVLSAEKLGVICHLFNSSLAGSDSLLPSSLKATCLTLLVFRMYGVWGLYLGSPIDEILGCPLKSCKRGRAGEAIRQLHFSSKNHRVTIQTRDAQNQNA